MRFSRITVRPDQMGGVPCIRALRIPVATVVGLLAQGMSREQILAEYPDLDLEDLREALPSLPPQWRSDSSLWPHRADVPHRQRPCRLAVAFGPPNAMPPALVHICSVDAPCREGLR